MLEARRNEFLKNIWNHSQDTFQTQFDERRPLTEEELAFLRNVSKAIKTESDDQKIAEELFNLINKDSDRLKLLLQLLGLTRSKIISDLKAAAVWMDPKPTIPTKYTTFVKTKKNWLVAGEYLVPSIRRVFGIFSESCSDEVMQALNQATWSGFMRQERAKRSGHEGEYRLAILLAHCGIPFKPVEKAENPLCPDIQINQVSFDIVIPNEINPKICVKATVHTSNIGQFGESKDHLEVEEAQKMLKKDFRTNRPILLALIDGIGFLQNSAGLNGVLQKADEFCQYNTLWKAGVIASRATGISLTLELAKSDIDEHEAFLKKYNFIGNTVPKEDEVTATRIAAGAGNFLFDESDAQKRLPFSLALIK